MSEVTPAPSETEKSEPAANSGHGLLGRLKTRLEAPEKGAATLTGTLRDYLLVTWAVPAEKVRPHVPAHLPLDVLPNTEGGLNAYLQVACFYHEDFHWSPFRGGGESFHQVSYRVLTRYQGKRGWFDFRTYLSTEEARNGLRVIARESDFARFTVHIAGDPARNTYELYNLRAVGDRGQTSLEVALPALQQPTEETGEASEAATTEAVAVPSPFARLDDMVQFLTQRDEIYFAASAPKNGIAMAPLRHEPLNPITTGVLKTARASLFTDLGLLTPDSLLQPVAVLIQPSFALTAYPPRLAKLTPPD